jgi:hypothetical protein
MELYEAHLLLRALRYGDKQGYGQLVLRSIPTDCNHKGATPYTFCMCTTCGNIWPSYMLCPLQDGCSSCWQSKYKGQQGWIYYSNNLHYFCNMNKETHTNIQTALSTMWELQENVSL